MQSIHQQCFLMCFRVKHRQSNITKGRSKSCLLQFVQCIPRGTESIAILTEHTLQGVRISFIEFTEKKVAGLEGRKKDRDNSKEVI